MGDGLQLLEGQAQGHRLEGGQIVHHELTALCQHHDGGGVIVLIDGGLRGYQGPPLHRSKPGDAVRLGVLAGMTLHGAGILEDKLVTSVEVTELQKSANFSCYIVGLVVVSKLLWIWWKVETHPSRV